MILDGKSLSRKIRKKIKLEISEHNYVPGLVVLIVGEDKSSNKYVNMKNIACKEVGIYSVIHRELENISEKELLNKIEMLNNNDKIDGILVQLPLPPHINQNKILEAISIEKDVDGFHPYNVGCLASGLDSFVPCTPLGVMELFKEYSIDIEGKDICMIGSSNIVGKPMANLLINNKATVTICNKNTLDLKKHTLNSDIIIVAAGVINLITKDMVQKDAIIIDIGINILDDGSLVGDVDFKNLKEKVSMITPVPGGVGPMTISMLLSNTLKAYKKRRNIKE